MICDLTEYEKAQEEIHILEKRLERLQQTHPIDIKGFTKAGIRKLIARLHEELAVFEGSEEARFFINRRLKGADSRTTPFDFFP